MKKVFLVGLLVALMCTAASAAMFEIDAPTSIILGSISTPTTVLTGAGPNGGDAYYRTSANGDDSAFATWNFNFAGMSLASTTYYCQVYISAIPSTLTYDNAPINYPWPGGAGDMRWVGDPIKDYEANPGWYNVQDWGYGTLVTLAKGQNMTFKWNPWGSHAGAAVSGVRISTDGNFNIPEPSSLLALLAGFPVLALLRRKR